VIKILLADDDPAVLQALTTLLEDAADFEIVGQVGDGIAAVETASRLAPDVALLDIKMPGVGGLTAAERIRQLPTRCAIVMLTTFGDDANVDHALSIGVDGFLLKTAAPSELINGLRTAHAGGVCISSSVIERLGRRAANTPAARPLNARTRDLTQRERELLTLLARGLTNDEIATALHLTEGTIKGYTSTLFSKIRARNRVEAALIAFEERI
jgi:DNA-binding NarL/FixJ family response regulator